MMDGEGMAGKVPLKPIIYFQTWRVGTKLNNWVFIYDICGVSEC